MRSFSANALWVVRSRRELPITITGAHTCRSAKTLRNPGQYRLPLKARWSRFAKSVVFTIITNAGLPNTLHHTPATGRVPAMIRRSRWDGPALRLRPPRIASFLVTEPSDMLRMHPRRVFWVSCSLDKRRVAGSESQKHSRGKSTRACPQGSWLPCSALRSLNAQSGGLVYVGIARRTSTILKRRAAHLVKGTARTIFAAHHCRDFCRDAASESIAILHSFRQPKRSLGFGSAGRRVTYLNP